MATPETLNAADLPASFAAACKFTPLSLRAHHRVTGAIQTVAVDRPYTFLGRVKGIGVHLDDPSVSQCHAYLQVIDGVPHCFDLGSRTGVLWDDGGRGQGPVDAGQTLRIGVFDVQISGGPEALPFGEPEERLPAELDHGALAAPPAVLELHAPGGTSGHFALDRPVALVGRHPNCNLRFLDPALSYFQCALVVTADGVWCVDLLSRKGTVVNGRATRLARLGDGDLIELGGVALVLHTGERPGKALVLNGRAGTALGPAPAGPSGAEVIAATVAPLRELLEQFQQSFVTMARMFATMQQEHTAMMCEQMRQIQELMRETRGAAAPAPAPAPPTTPAPPMPPLVTPKVPTPKVTPQGPETEVLTDAHDWFLGRLAQKGQPAAKPKPE